MSYRTSQLPPKVSTRVSNIRVLVSNNSAAPERLKNMQFLRSWFEYDCDAEQSRASSLNWNAILGLGFMIGVSVTFWTAVGFWIERTVK